MLLKYIIIVYFQYIRALFLDKKGDYFLAGECLKGKKNSAYRLHESDKKLRLLGFKVVKRSLLRLFGERFVLDLQVNANEIALLDEEPTRVNNERIDFIERVLGKKVGLYLAKEELMGYPMSTVNRFIILNCIILHSIFLIPLCIISKNRVFHALALYYVIESVLTLFLIKKANINEIVLSNIYSQDSNINYLIFSNQVIQVIKNPSEDPLAFDNSVLLADQLIICNPYQIEELKIIDTIKVKSIVNGLPEQINRYEGKYEESSFATQKNVVGYYSSGSWLRKQQSRNYFHMGVDCALEEEKLLLDLKNFIFQNPTYSIKIFKHPIEKKNLETIELTNNYYNSILENHYILNDINLQTCLSFETCDTAISLLSGASLYRLTFGYKSLYYVSPESFPSFPFENSSLDAINIGNKGDFNSFLLQQMTMSEKDFFDAHQLNKYRYSNLCSKLGNIEQITVNHNANLNL